MRKIRIVQLYNIRKYWPWKEIHSGPFFAEKRTLYNILKKGVMERDTETGQKLAIMTAKFNNSDGLS